MPTKLDATLPMLSTICGMAAVARLYTSLTMASESSSILIACCKSMP